MERRKFMENLGLGLVGVATTAIASNAIGSENKEDKEKKEKENKEKKLRRFLKEILKAMPSEHSILENEIRFVENEKDLEDVIPENAIREEVKRAGFVMFHFKKEIVVLGYTNHYQDSIKFFEQGYKQVVWLWVTGLAHERYHLMRAKDRASGKEQVPFSDNEKQAKVLAQKVIEDEEHKAYEIELNLIIEFEKKKLFVGMEETIADRKKEITNIIQGITVSENYMVSSEAIAFTPKK